jgi:myo-inositol-1-phosphate synthase
VRLCKLALNKGIGGSLVEPSSYLMKSPPKQVPDPVARDLTEKFIADNARTQLTAVGSDKKQAKVKT